MPHVMESPFPNCCTAYCIYNFGGTLTTAQDNYNPTYDQLYREISDKIDENKGRYVTLAMTNNSQKVANQVLRDLGFEHTKWMTKDQHPGTKIRFWWLSPKNRRKAVRR